MLKKLALAGLAVIAVVTPRAAEARDFATIYVECGLGALIAPRTPVVAVITNITWDLGTTAISSELSSPESCKGVPAETASFINDAYDQLEGDLAAGGGSHLEMLASLVGFEPDSKERHQFIAQLRSDFTEYVAQWDYPMQNQFTRSEALYNMVFAHVAG